MRTLTLSATPYARLQRSASSNIRPRAIQSRPSAANCQQQRVHARQPQRASASAPASATVRPWRPRWLHVSIFQLHREAKSPANRDQLLRPAWAASGLHQRCQEHVCISEPALRLQEGGHGSPDRRSTKPDEPAYQGEHPPSYALAGKGCAAERLTVLPLLRSWWSDTGSRW